MRLQHIYNHNKRGMHYLDSKTVFFYLMVTIPQKKFDPHFLQQSHHPHNLNTGYKKNKKLFPYGSLNLTKTIFRRCAQVIDKTF
jgi:hypothetical protein